LTEHQLRWLVGVLAEPAPKGTIIAMHHPPMPGVQPLTQLVELRGQRAFADVVRGTDVRAIIAGHLHYSSFSTFAGIPVSVASATCYTQDLVGEVLDDGTRSTRGRDTHQSYNLVQIFEDTIVHAVVQQGGGNTVGEPVPAAEVSRRLEAAGLVARSLESAHAR
jgi:3',5'-cyclic AMP phosphodiesterase CpdA